METITSPACFGLGPCTVGYIHVYIYKPEPQLTTSVSVYRSCTGLGHALPHSPNAGVQHRMQERMQPTCDVDPETAASRMNIQLASTCTVSRTLSEGSALRGAISTRGFETTQQAPTIERTGAFY